MQRYSPQPVTVSSLWAIVFSAIVAGGLLVSLIDALVVRAYVAYQVREAEARLQELKKR